MLPTISVIIVNLNGRMLLRECLEALSLQDYPQEQIEIILVDNGSSDGSVQDVRENYPQVQIIEVGRNLGFAGGNNLGARQAKGMYLAFINNDARATPSWLRAMVEALEADPEATCASAKMLNHDGTLFDFVGTALNLYGRAFQIDENLPAFIGTHDKICEIFAPCGGAMLILRDVFLKIGGFDEDYIAYYEDVDLGWRLWLYGYKVVFVPQSIVYHYKQQTGGRFPVEQRYVLSEMNALRTLIKNYEEQNLWKILTTSLFLGVKRSLDQAKLDRNPYLFGQMPSKQSLCGDLASEPCMTRTATAFLVAIDQIAEELPILLEKRHYIQQARVRSDAELFTHFPLYAQNPLFPWRKYHVVQDQLSTALDIPDALQPYHGSRLLIITHETIGPKMAGPGIRAWEMACVLAERFEVTLAAPLHPTRTHPNLYVVGYDATDPYYRDLVPYINSADVIMAMGPLFVNNPQLQDLNKPTIVDLYDPFELERLAHSDLAMQGPNLHLDLENVLSVRFEGAVGDFFICASERQRDFWLGVLLAGGRVNTTTYAQDAALYNLIDVVPFGIPDTPPRKQKPVLKGVRPGIGPQDKVLLWNGGLWQWFDPLTLIDALVQVLKVRDDVRLFFAAGQHFNTNTVKTMPIHAQTVAYCRDLDLLEKYVFWGDWIPYDERGAYLLEADLGISIHRPTVESRFASRTRLLDCLWASLPVIVTEGDPLSEIIAKYNLGCVVPASQPDILAQTILELLADETLRERVNKAAIPLQTQLAWSQVIKPISDFLERAAFAPDALEASRCASRTLAVTNHLVELQTKIVELQTETARLQQETGLLKTHLEAIQQGRVMRIMNAINSIFSRNG